MSFWGSLFGGSRGPYGEDRFSMLRKDRSMRSGRVDEDRLQGDGNRDWFRRQCLDLYRTSGLAKAAVQRVSNYSTVCRPYPITSDDNWNRESIEFWDNWAKIADYRGRPGSDLCALTRLTHIADHLVGESLFLFTAGGQLQPIEADRIETPQSLRADPMIVGGIRFNTSGRITHYYVCDRDRNGNIDSKRFRRVAAENMVHVVEPWRVDMLHGIPRLHAAVQKLMDYDETDEAMRGKVKNEARSFLKAKSELPAGGPRTRYGGEGQTKYKVHETQLGSIWEGGDIEIVESKSPNSSYTPHMVEEARAVAAAVEIPYEYLMLIFTAGSYNAQKGARLAFADTCIRRADMVSRMFHGRVWNWRIAKAINDKDLPPAPVRERWDGLKISEWNRVEWGKPRFQDIDLGRDVSAKSAAWAAGQQSLRDQRDAPYQVLEDKVEDILRADELAQKANAILKTGKITWQNVINAGVPGLTVEPIPADNAETEEKPNEE